MVATSNQKRRYKISAEEPWFECPRYNLGTCERR